METTKETLLNALAEFIGQRPGMEFVNYGNAKDYRAESRRVTKQAHDAVALLGAVARSSCVGPDDILRHATGGRLEWTGKGFSYTAGQYFATEYRWAAGSLLASALWDGHLRANLAMGIQTDGNAMRKAMRNILGARLARKFFN